MKNKLYFRDENSEHPYLLEHHLDDAREDELEEITLFEAVRDTTHSEFIFCKFHDKVLEKENCGRGCEGYNPSNKRNDSGLCLERGKLYTWGEKKTFKV